MMKKRPPTVLKKMVSNPKAIVYINDEDVVFVDDKQLEQTWKECNIFL
jgi:hypothetical protein